MYCRDVCPQYKRIMSLSWYMWYRLDDGMKLVVYINHLHENFVSILNQPKGWQCPNFTTSIFLWQKLSKRNLQYRMSLRRIPDSLCLHRCQAIIQISLGMQLQSNWKTTLLLWLRPHIHHSTIDMIWLYSDSKWILWCTLSSRNHSYVYENNYIVHLYYKTKKFRSIHFHEVKTQYF